MLTLLFYEAEADTPTPVTALEDALEGAGVMLEGAPGSAYRPGRWHDPRTGARATLDLGSPDFDGDDDPHPPTVYSGWRALPLTVHIPLAGPHWQAVEALTLVERLLAALPGVHALDTEDTRVDDDADAGPYPWSRPRRIAHWEILRRAQGLSAPRLDRGASLLLWRWRRERAAAALTHAELTWPESLVLLDRSDGRARSAALIPEDVSALALPPVELLVIRRPGHTGCLPMTALGPAHDSTLPLGARHCAAETLADALARHALLPVTRFAALLDEDWQD